jgi:hypothetical protein
MIAFGAAAELDALGIFRPLQIPHVAAAQPVIRLFDLITVFDALAEHAVFIADAVADDRQAERGATVHEAGRQPAQAAVAQARVIFAFGQFFQGQTHLIEGFVNGFIDPQIEHGITQRSAHEKFHGQVVSPAHATVGLVGIAGVLPTFPQPVAQSECQSFIHVVGIFSVPVAAQGVAEIVAKVSGDALGVHAQWGKLRQPGRWVTFF